MNMDIATVNALPYEDFVDILGNVVEKCPMITAAVWSGRPFLSLAALEAAIREFIDALPESGKEGILRCHPDLAGRDLQSGSLTRESHEEQAGSGMGALNSGSLAHGPAQPGVQGALRNERAVERARGIEEVKKICHLRLQSLVLTDNRL
ncbi:2-oxo-4-hydroxy-4-carboxy-5-ureidoimidazoline decarboxylase [Dissostichus eleginoides]|uniref:2-oxo-4-hydroxy-4-carboxy-5-ureidoimidazoline decarboxylase n=1 Tax=Dissostichus eleginoides TaxID=100907 RepID=A0AAD9F1H9_DISEL|nr:2-oxo-4-hydroxy-4-carboxy-5-ureidoimidazoline decarboxylase [Dissostichus eleginoides]